MIRSVFSSSGPVTLVGGGVVGETDLAVATRLAPDVVAADSGAATALAAGHVPHAVIGDFDSLDSATRARFHPDTLHHVAEQNSTDFEKALTRTDAPLVLAIGFTGARVDHQLAVFSALVRYAHRPCLVLAEHEVILHCPPRLALDMGEGEIVSLFPLLPVAGRSEGLYWPINGLPMAPAQQIGTSNRATGGPLILEMEGPGMILLLPRAHLEPVTQALLHPAQGPARWPAP
jgi:thiamine pyrophosphokinase